jgi:quercetin dioxygenase-like cupin family protein
MAKVLSKLLAPIVLSGMMASAGSASTPVNFTGTPLVGANFDETAKVNSERIKFQTKEATDTAEVRLEWGAGGSSGWHHHPGMVLVQVASGSVVVTRVINGQCESTTYGAHETFVEGDTMHNGYSPDGAVAYATAIVADGEPARIEDVPPSCANGPGIRTPNH